MRTIRVGGVGREPPKPGRMRRVNAAAALRAVPADARPLVERVVACGETLGLGVHLVGGPVRDLLLGRPLVDVDLLVESRGEPSLGAAVRLGERAAAVGERCIAHPRFGTARLVGSEAAVDLAAARAERYARAGALPDGRAAPFEEDLARRDFSVNALAIPLNAVARAGRAALIDRFRGVDDLASRRLRILHASSFHDDPTRALRAARFTSRLGFRLEGGSSAALRRALAAGALRGVSGDRLRAELARVFSDAAADPGVTLSRLARWGVLEALVRGLGGGPRGALRRLPKLLGEPALTADALLVGLMVWLSAEPATRRRRVLSRLAVGGRPGERVRAWSSRLRQLERRLAASRRPSADDAALAPLPPEERLAAAAQVNAAQRRRILAHARRERELELPVSGRDLTAQGLAGPAVGRALARVRAAVLDGRVRTREEALLVALERRS